MLPQTANPFTKALTEALSQAVNLKQLQRIQKDLNALKALEAIDSCLSAGNVS